MFEALKKILFFIELFQKYLIFWKRKQIIDSKNESIESGDQRVFENSINSNSNDADLSLPVGKYGGLHERPVKKKP